MAKTTQNVVIYSCDGCNVRKTAPSEALADRPTGIYGTVETDADGGSADWFAHAGRCIARAVNAVLAAPEPVTDPAAVAVDRGGETVAVAGTTSKVAAV